MYFPVSRQARGGRIHGYVFSRLLQRSGVHIVAPSQGMQLTHEGEVRLMAQCYCYPHLQDVTKRHSLLISLSSQKTTLARILDVSDLVTAG